MVAKEWQGASSCRQWRRRSRCCCCGASASGGSKGSKKEVWRWWGLTDALRLQDGGHRQRVRPATARGLGGQSTGDARPPRGGCFLKRRLL